MRRKILGLGLAVMAAAVLLTAPMTASAATASRVSGSWGSSHYVLQVTPDNGKLESDLNVTKAVNGQTWVIKMQDNGVLFATKTATVKNNEFEVKGFATNASGSDVIKIIATNQTTGMTYTASLTF